METEQIVEIEGSEPLSSFVVVRGSVPLRWSQPLQDLYWRFRLWVRKPIDDTPLRAHFEALVARHSRVTVIDLLRAKGSEATLRDALAHCGEVHYSEDGMQTLTTLPGIRLSP